LPWFKEATSSRGGYEIVTNDVATRAQELFAATQAQGLPVRTLQLRRSTLEDVFLKLTGRSMRDA
jgi:ABC-2 type transport system ATP-binding protein